MTKTTTVASKAFVAIVAAAMVFSLVAPAAKAATAEELQAQITALMAQIASLQGGAQAPVLTTGGNCAAIPAPLTMNASGASVTALQNYLISAKQSIPAGATGFFGAQTRSALAAWQTANGVMPAAGYYGPVTAAKMASMCTPVTPGTGTTTTPTTPGTSADLQGEASLDTLEIDSASDDTLEEGAEEAEIAEVTVQFADGDAEISRMDVTLDGVAEVWDVLETVSIWVDGKMVAEMNADDEDEYLDTTANSGTLRFSGLDIVAMEDEDVVITIGATVQGNVDNADQGTYTVAVDAIRFFDADGVSTTEDDAADFDLSNTVNFTIEAAGADDEVIVKTSSEDPDGTTLQVKDDKKSDDFTVFAFDIDTDDSTNDIELNTVVVNLLTTVTGYDTLVDDAELVIDGVTIDDVTVNGVTNAAGTAILTFDVDGDVTIDAGDRVKAELVLTFKSLALANEGATIRGSVTAAIDAEGADDVTGTGSATGDIHTLRTSGISADFDAADANVTVVDLATNDYATYEISVEVTAFDQDVYISTNPATSITYALENGAGVAAVAGTRSVTLTSTGDENAGYFEINEGETETITLEVTYTPGAASTAARLALTSIIFNDAASMVTPQTWTASPVTTYRTNVVTIVN